jgi:hypothetical protein
MRRAMLVLRVVAACSLILTVAPPIAALADQASLPTTACDTALTNPELHFPPTMSLEPGGGAFRYGTDTRPFVTQDGAAITITIRLGFDPTADASIRFAALDANCDGNGTGGTVLGYTFNDVADRENIVTYDLDAATIAFNGTPQHAVPLGTPRYAWIEVWDGQPNGQAAFSYLIDLINPVNPSDR